MKRFWRFIRGWLRIKLSISSDFIPVNEPKMTIQSGYYNTQTGESGLLQTVYEQEGEILTNGAYRKCKIVFCEKYEKYKV